MCVQNWKFVALPVPEIIGGTETNSAVPNWYAHSPFSPKFLKSFCSHGPCEYTCQNKFVALRVPEIIRGAQKFGPSLDTPTLPFLQKFSWACARMDQLNVSAKVAVRSISRCWDNSDCTFLVGLRTPNLGEGEDVGGRGWHCSKERLRFPVGSP